MSVTTCLMPLPRWHDVPAVAAAGFAAPAAAPVAAIEVPARPSVPSSVAELAAAVTRNQAAWRPARLRASRPVLMSFPLMPQARAPGRRRATAHDARLSARSEEVLRCLFV